MSPLSRIVSISTTLVLVAGLGVGCQTTAAKKTTVAPTGNQALPPPPPPSWDTPGKTAYTPAAQSNAKLTPKMEVTWTIISDQQKYMTGPSVVGPDGTVVIGPYGQFKVAGMTVTQASEVIEKGVRQYLPNSRVQLALAVGVSAFTAPAPGTTWSSNSGNASGVKSANYTPPDWTPADKAAVPACPQCAAAAAAAAAATPPVTPAAIPPAAPTPSPANKRGPVMTWVFGPRY